MNNTISRRSIARGSAWAFPAVALASAAPASAASFVCSNRPLTDARLNVGVCCPQGISVVGAKKYSTTGGGAVSATTLSDLALVVTMNYKGSVSVYWTAGFGLGNHLFRRPRSSSPTAPGSAAGPAAPSLLAALSLALPPRTA